MKRLALAGAIALALMAPACADPVTDALDHLFKASTVRNLRTVRIPPARGFRHGRIAVRERVHAYSAIWRGDSGVSTLIASYVSARLGPHWVPVALQIARIESGGRCGAANPSGAVGLFQVMHPEQFGVSRAAARTCNGGVVAGVAHMARCVARGARTDAQMMACHNTGSPFSRRVERAYRRYVRR
jgi:hypothetical protein